MSQRTSRLLLGCIAIGFLTLLAYIPALQSGFIWDDNNFVWDNKILHSPDALYRFWFTTDPPDYFPLTSSMLWCEWQLWGMNASGYHFVNMLIHALGAMVLWRVLALLRLPGAWLAALLFALHPVNVESVAWITERKNTLPMLLSLLSVLFYLRSGPVAAAPPPPVIVTGKTRKKRGNIAGPVTLPAVATAGHWWRSGSYLASVALFLLALLAKTSVVMLPAALLVIAWWRNGRIALRDLFKTAPLFALAAMFSLVTIWYQYNRSIGEMIVRTDGFWSRLAGAGMAVWFYLSKALVPVDLQFVYPRWEIDTSSFSSYLPLMALVALFVLLWRRRIAWGRGPLAALAIYVVMLVPVLGFFNIFFMMYSLVADHWQYPSMPVFVAAITAEAAGLSQRSPAGVRVGRVAAIAVICVFFVLTVRQQAMYKNEETLYRTIVKRRPDCWMAQNNLGGYLYEHGRKGEALEQWRTTIRYKPDHPEAHNNISRVLTESGRHAEALPWCLRAIEIRPGWAPVHFNVARILGKIGGDPNFAGYHFLAGLLKTPHDKDALYDFAVVLGQQGNYGDAVYYFMEALKVKPDWAEAHHGIAACFTQLGNGDQARAHLENALRLKPDLVEANTDFGSYWFSVGDFKQAAYYYRQAVRVAPEFIMALYNLSTTEAELGNFGDAAALAERTKIVAAKTGDREILAEIDTAIEAYRNNRTLRKKARPADAALQYPETGQPQAVAPDAAATGPGVSPSQPPGSSPPPGDPASVPAQP